MSLFLNLFVFFLEKSYHSNLAITFYVDHEWPNGFQHQIDQARNCPFRLSDDRWRHVRWRNELLHNCKNCQTGGPFYEKRMNSKMIKIAPNSSLINVLINGQPSLTILIPKKWWQPFWTWWRLILILNYLTLIMRVNKSCLKWKTKHGIVKSSIWAFQIYFSFQNRISRTCLNVVLKDFTR